MRKSVGENVKFTQKFRKFYPQFGPFLPLKDLCLSILCSQKALRALQKSNINFWTWVFLSSNFAAKFPFLSTETTLPKIYAQENSFFRQEPWWWCWWYWWWWQRWWWWWVQCWWWWWRWWLFKPETQVPVENGPGPVVAASWSRL